MDITPLELKRETIFKDAVLSQAEAHSMAVIAEAGRQRAQELEAAYAKCEAADPVVIAQRLAHEADRSIAAISGEAHRDLLAWREGLVAELFADVEKRLDLFTKSGDYLPWLRNKLRAHAGFTGADGKGITLSLRAEDTALADELKKTLRQADVVIESDICLGGVRIANGKILYDETMDAALADQKRAFYESGELRL